MFGVVVVVLSDGPQNVAVVEKVFFNFRVIVFVKFASKSPSRILETMAWSYSGIRTDSEK